MNGENKNATRIRCMALVGLLSLTLVGGSVAAPGTAAQAEDHTTVFRTTLQEPNQRTAEVSTDELRAVLAAGSATVLDARPHLEWSISHVPGALNVAPKPDVPVSLYVSDVAEIGRVGSGKDAPLVLYCNGPFCGKSKRLAEELLDAGYSDVRRYQLGAPVWRALGGVMQIEPDGLRYVREGDRTAVWFDARTAEDIAAGTLPGARHLPKTEVSAAKDDGRLPMDDHNTRIVVFGRDGAQARATAEEVARNAFHNVAFFDGPFDALRAALP